MKKFQKQFINTEIQPVVDKNTSENIKQSKPQIIGKHMGMIWDPVVKQLMPHIVPNSICKGFGRTWEDIQKAKK